MKSGHAIYCQELRRYSLLLHPDGAVDYLSTIFTSSDDG